MLKNKKILIVDDEEDIITLLEYNLKNAGFKVVTAQDGPEALTLAKKEIPDLILLDIMLPGMEGTEVCKMIKKDQSLANIPVIMLTAKGEEIDRILGLELGAEDYITKPFSPRELVLRVKSVLKRGYVCCPENSENMVIGPFLIDLNRSEISYERKILKLTATEFKLLAELAKAKDRVLSRDALINKTMGTDYYVTERTIDTHIRRLRKKLGKGSKYIETVRGFGYKFLEDK